MRKPEAMGYFAVPGDDGEPRAMHAVLGKQPQYAVAITVEQAREISAAVRAREAAQSPATVPVPAVDAASKAELDAIKAKLDALAADHAAMAPLVSKHEGVIANMVAQATKLAGGSP